MTIMTTCLTKRFAAIEISTLLLLNFSEAVETSCRVYVKYCFYGRSDESSLHGIYNFQDCLFNFLKTMIGKIIDCSYQYLYPKPSEHLKSTYIQVDCNSSMLRYHVIYVIVSLSFFELFWIYLVSFKAFMVFWPINLRTN